MLNTEQSKVKENSKYRSLVFDLDDTLLDTSGLLVPMAAMRACQAMIQAGLNCSLEECMKMRHQLAAELSHTDIFTRIADSFGTQNKGKAVHDALDSFYNPDIPHTLPLMQGAKENLVQLSENYSLYLVTMGSHSAQTEKIQALGIEKYFKKIFIMNGFIGERKQIAFQKILAEEQHHPHELLSVGNRLSSEIRDAKQIGSDTCYFAYGEHVGERVQIPEDNPDFTIFHHKDLIHICGL